MNGADATHWTMVRQAAAGSASARAEFAAIYEPVVRSYLAARWRGMPYARAVDDTVQEVFLDLLRDGGALSRAEPGHSGGFRAYLYGIARIAALRAERAMARHDERQPAHVAPHVDHLPADDPGVSSTFDHAWAEAMVRRAGQRQRERAARAGPDAERRVELLRLRFEDGLPIREIALRWNEDPDRVHHEYAKARREFREALLDVVAEHHPGASREEVAAEASKLLNVLS